MKNKKVNIRKSIYGIIKIIIFLFILLLCFQPIYNTTKRKESYETMEQFFFYKDFEVLFFGSSHVKNGVFPMQLWNDYGIVSYNLGQNAAFLAGVYYNMLLACKETTPKLVVIDTYAIGTDHKVSTNTSKVHTMLDTYPISYTKYLAVKDLFGTDKLLENEMEYLFNFSIYHGRWNELKENDFVKKEEYEKGASSRIGVATPNKMGDINSSKIYDGKETKNMQYLRKIIEYCKEKEIQILVTYLPHPVPDYTIEASRYVQKICDDYNVKYINFLMLDTVNYDTDCYDNDSHLNPSGARKVTDYLGKYIIDNYDIQNRKDDEEYQYLNQDYNKYIDYKINNLKENDKKLNNYLMLLYDEEDIGYNIKIASKRNIESDSTIGRLLKNINNNYEIDNEVFKDNPNKTIKITTWDKRDGKEIATVWF